MCATVRLSAKLPSTGWVACVLNRASGLGNFLLLPVGLGKTSISPCVKPMLFSCTVLTVTAPTANPQGFKYPKYKASTQSQAYDP